MPQSSPTLPFCPVRNSELFANHWLESRLPREPEWREQRDNAASCLDMLAQIWADKQELLSPDLGELTMEDEWVHPALDAFGWKYVYQTRIQGRQPDYALFLDDLDKREALHCGKSKPGFWDKVCVVADAKAWDLNLDRPSRASGKKEFPPEQIEWYLNRTQINWGLLTNGRIWRLSPRELRRSQPRFSTYLEIDLPRIIERWHAANGHLGHSKASTLEEFMPWYLLATPVGFSPIKGRIPLIERALSGSTEYRVGVGDALRSQVFEALRLCIEGFLSHDANKLDAADDIDECRANAFTLLFRLLFVLFCEDRLLLPYGSNQSYTKACSLSRQHHDLRDRLLSPSSTAVWQDWSALFDIIDQGKATYGVPAYNGGLFEADAHPFLQRVELPDDYAFRVLDQLRRAPEIPGDVSSDRVRVDYRDLAIQHLGNVYEGLLELHPRYASAPMVVIRSKGAGKTSERTIAVADDIPDGFAPTETTYAAGEVYLETDKGDRRASGSYYTPDHIVSYIVENTLGPLCRDIDQQLGVEIKGVETAYKAARGARREALGVDLERLRGEYDDRVLRLTVLDPAMGSGHFLLLACQYLAEQIATNPHAADPGEPDDAAGDEPTLMFWKRRVVERCLYGVDKNPIAVELAKLALWLETVAVDRPLSFLDHHLRHGDSLVGGRLDTMGRLHDPRIKSDAQIRTTVEHYTDAMLRPLDEIRAMPSQTVKQVKEKERLYRRAFEPRRRPFVHLGDLWVSDFFLAEDERLSPDEYADAVKLLGKPMKFAELMSEEVYRRAIEAAESGEIDAFHWELEFPEVFLSPLRRRAGRQGFDAIIGNPPYDVLAEKELGRDLSALKAYIEAVPIYDPSRRGKNNLYKLFICRALDLLADKGRFGFIVPMTLLGDKTTSGVRKAIFDAGALTAVEAFPQKDNAAKRVFSEAKLATTVFTMLKTDDPDARAQPFRSRQHPENGFKDESPSLQLAISDIELYDPECGAIPSCSQKDWDVAMQLGASNRLSRLGAYAESFQGEVNETRDRKLGSISYDSNEGVEVWRGAHVCLYIARDASQGRTVYLDTTSFLDGKSLSSKAYHHKCARIGFQRKSPQNNFRRLIATLIPRGQFVQESISYIPENHCALQLEVILAMLNSKLLDWHFRLGSTNAMVGEYEIDNLPCPVFDDQAPASEHTQIRDASTGAVAEGRFDAAFDAIAPLLAEPPFSKAVQDVLVDLVKRIIRIERARGEIARAERSKLAKDAQPLQNLIDRIIYAMAGLSDDEARGLEERLANML